MKEERKEAMAIKENQLQVRNDFDALMQQFIDAQDVKPNSKVTYQRMLKQFFSWIQVEAINNPDRETILKYKHYLESKGLSPLSISGYIVAVRKFFEWTESIKKYPNIAKSIKGAKRVRGFRKDPLTISQVKELLSIDRGTIEGKRDYALLNLMIRTGLRTIEVIRADAGDIRQEGGEAVLNIQGKGRDCKDDFVVLTESILNPINEYLSSRGEVKDDDPLFASLRHRGTGDRLTTHTVSYIAKTYLRDIGINTHRISAHSLRHTAITLSLQAGATLQEAKALGRHVNIQTTLSYAHNINRIVNAPERKIDILLAS